MTFHLADTYADVLAAALRRLTRPAAARPGDIGGVTLPHGKRLASVQRVVLGHAAAGGQRQGLLGHHHRRRGVPRLRRGHRRQLHRPRPPARRQGDRRAGAAVHPRAGQRVQARPARAAGGQAQPSCHRASIDTFFFANSGAEITEAAIKLAKQVTKRPHTIVFSGSFHGRTHMAMAMTTSKTGYRAGHFALPAGVFVAPYPDPLAADQDAAVAEALEGLRPPAEVDDRARRDGGGDPRAGARRGWLHPGAAGVHDRSRRALPAARHHVRRRRGAERVRPHRQDVRRRALRHRARHHLHGQGHRQWLPVLRARHSPRARRQVADGQPRRHLRRQRHRAARRRWRRSRS